MSAFTLQFDGASRGNPGPGGCGALLLRGGSPYWRGSKALGWCTNNEAEYAGLLLGLNALVGTTGHISTLRIEGDSELVVRQMTGVYALRAANLLAPHATAEALTAALRKRLIKVEFAHVSREQNVDADRLANQFSDMDEYIGGGIGGDKGGGGGGGGGDRAKRSREDPAPAPPQTEEALTALITKREAEFEAELAPLRAKRDQLKAARLAAEAAEAARQKAEAEERARKAAAEAAERALKEAAEAARRAREEEARKRGNFATYSLREPATSSFECESYETDRCIALGHSRGDGIAFRITEGGGWSYTAGLPLELHKLFKHRSLSHPSPTYVQLGYEPRPAYGYDSPSTFTPWLVKFANGKVSWSVTSPFAEDYNSEVAKGKCLQVCAFGAPGSHLMLFTDGSATWRGLSERHTAKLNAAPLTFVSLGPQDQMFVRYSGRKYGWVDGPKEAMDKVSALTGQGRDVRQVLFGGEHCDEYVIRYS
jgi:ribonuclease HI